MHIGTQEAIKEKLKEFKTPEEQSQYMKELFGSAFDVVLNAEIAERFGKHVTVQKAIQDLKDAGMTSGGIRQFMKASDSVNVSREKITAIIEEDLPEMREWLARPLEKRYPIVFLDAMHSCKVKENGKTVQKVAHHVLGVTMDGIKELLGIWIAETEGARFWAQVLIDIKNRGVDDILICCTDGLKGFPQAINNEFPCTTIQRCVNHLMRKSSVLIQGKKKKQFCGDLKEVYNAPTEEAGYAALQEMKIKWPLLAPYLQNWENAWQDVAPFFGYSQPVRKLIYTTNPIESLHSVLRRAIDVQGVFSNDEALRLTLWRAQRNLARKWANTPIQDWGVILGQLSLMFPERNLLE